MRILLQREQFSLQRERLLGGDAETIHARLIDTMGNLTLTAYNQELGNLSFAEKKEKLSNTHIELNRWILDQSSWNAEQILKRAEALLKKSIRLWPGR